VDASGGSCGAGAAIVGAAERERRERRERRRRLEGRLSIFNWSHHTLSG